MLVGVLLLHLGLVDDSNPELSRGERHVSMEFRCGARELHTCEFPSCRSVASVARGRNAPDCPAIALCWSRQCFNVERVATAAVDFELKRQARKPKLAVLSSAAPSKTRSFRSRHTQHTCKNISGASWPPQRCSASCTWRSRPSALKPMSPCGAICAAAKCAPCLSRKIIIF